MPSLADKFIKLHTKRSTETIFFYVFLFGGVFLIFYEGFYILPYYVERGETQIPNIHLFFLFWFAVNIYGNMYKLVTVDITGRNIVSPAGDAPKGWKYCAKCVKNSPERSHHCPLCDVCVLKRDHHCFFAAGCIGYHNHRYYVAMVIYMVIAGIYANVFNLSFVLDIKGEMSVLKSLSFIVPHVGFLFFGEDLYTTTISMLTFVGLLITVLFTWLLAIQIVQILNGQTKYELKKGITQYRTTIWKTLREIGGKHWYAILLFPWLPSPLPGDGTTFECLQTKQL